MTKGYLVGMITVDNAEAYKPYIAQATPLVTEYGGRYLIRGGEKNTVEGNAAQDRVVVIEFDDMETVQRFYDDPRYVEIRKIRQDNSQGVLMQVMGYDMP